MHWRAPPPPRDPRNDQILESLTGFAIICILVWAVGYIATHFPPPV